MKNNKNDSPKKKDPHFFLFIPFLNERDKLGRLPIHHIPHPPLSENKEKHNLTIPKGFRFISNKEKTFYFP